MRDGNSLPDLHLLSGQIQHACRNVDVSEKSGFVFRDMRKETQFNKESYYYNVSSIEFMQHQEKTVLLGRMGPLFLKVLL